MLRSNIRAPKGKVTSQVEGRGCYVIRLKPLEDKKPCQIPPVSDVDKEVADSIKAPALSYKR
jgi:hypothetical protein